MHNILTREVTAMRYRNQDLDRGQERLKMHGDKENTLERRKKNDAFVTVLLLVQQLIIQNQELTPLSLDYLMAAHLGGFCTFAELC